MPRTARLTFPEGFYHIYNRGINKAVIFRTESDYRRVLATLSELVKDDDWTVYAYCFMPNHYHLLVEEKKVPVAKLISRLFTSYSAYFNRKYERCGPVFQDRFKSKIIQKDAYFLEVSRYIHCNPAKAGLVADPFNYEFSSLAEYSGKTMRQIINLDKVIKLVGNNKMDLMRYREFVMNGLRLDLSDFDPFKKAKDVIGSRIFSTHRKRQCF
jgi:putative transposase